MRLTSGCCKSDKARFIKIRFTAIEEEWSITDKDWPFLSPDNSLVVRVKVRGPRRTTWTALEQDGRFFVQSDRTGLMWAPTHATVDGVEKDVAVSTRGGRRNSIGLEFLLPGGREIIYDPVVELDSSRCKRRGSYWLDAIPACRR